MLQQSDFDFPDFQTVWAEILPLSVYGKEYKRQAKIFRRGEEEELRNFYEELRQWQEHISAHQDFERELRGIFASLPDITDILNQPIEITLRDDQFLRLRRFTLAAGDIRRILEQYNFTPEELISLLVALESIEDCWNKFCTEGSHFEISPAKNPELAGFNAAIAQLTRAYSSARKAMFDVTSGQLGRTVGESFKISGDELLTKDLIGSGRFTWRMDETGEVVFTHLEDESIREIFNLREEKIYEQQTCLLNIKLELSRCLAHFAAEIAATAKAFGKADYLITVASWANENKYKIPEISDAICIIQEAWHPILQARLAEAGENFTPRTIELEAGVASLIGSNMGGKTVTLRLILLLFALFHRGLPLPVQEAEMPLLDYFLMSSDSSDSIKTGLSKFGRQLEEMTFAVNNKSRRGLVLLDEIAHAAAPKLAQALAETFIEEMQSGESIVLITTHLTLNYPEGVKEWRMKGARDIKEAQSLAELLDYTIMPVSIAPDELEQFLMIIEFMGLPMEIADKIALNYRKAGERDE